jgi:hypothetical protein
MKENSSIEGEANILKCIEGVSYSRWESYVLMQLYEITPQDKFRERVELMIPKTAQLSEHCWKILFRDRCYEV